ncbi:acylphosphatase [Candidatus Bathycorpusculum sp.]|jgi:acylphosphatase|uniref:acylphosphatase n=1 Tax=Candidatus Bathycorpusculum sp. TaxID=2994959 RepID=UPI002821435C|nr:acylphosphatase [Candidatus Termitimicrobium sp.]MCL2685207.1 acylphosphatase [Candidatus Termitimicrobium sp.]
MTKTRAHVYISGKVQGVYFRQNTKNQALHQSVTGWVRNLDDGSVEAVFEGEDASVRAVVDFCRVGPRGASVTGVAVAWEPYQAEFQSFEII